MKVAVNPTEPPSRGEGCRNPRQPCAELASPQSLGPAASLCRLVGRPRRTAMQPFSPREGPGLCVPADAPASRVRLSCQYEEGPEGAGQRATKPKAGDLPNRRLSHYQKHLQTTRWKTKTEEATSSYSPRHRWRSLEKSRVSVPHCAFNQQRSEEEQDAAWGRVLEWPQRPAGDTQPGLPAPCFKARARSTGHTGPRPARCPGPARHDCPCPRHAAQGLCLGWHHMWRGSGQAGGEPQAAPGPDDTKLHRLVSFPLTTPRTLRLLEDQGQAPGCASGPCTWTHLLCHLCNLGPEFRSRPTTMAVLCPSGACHAGFRVVLSPVPACLHRAPGARGCCHQGHHPRQSDPTAPCGQACVHGREAGAAPYPNLVYTHPQSLQDHMQRSPRGSCAQLPWWPPTCTQQAPLHQGWDPREVQSSLARQVWAGHTNGLPPVGSRQTPEVAVSGPFQPHAVVPAASPPECPKARRWLPLQLTLILSCLDFLDSPGMRTVHNGRVPSLLTPFLGS